MYRSGLQWTLLASYDAGDLPGSAVVECSIDSVA